MTPFAVSDLGRILSVGAISLKIYRFCGSKNGGIGEVTGFQHRMPCTWQLLSLAVEQPWLALVRPFLSVLTQMGIEKAPLHL